MWVCKLRRVNSSEINASEFVSYMKITTFAVQILNRSGSNK